MLQRTKFTDKNQDCVSTEMISIPDLYKTIEYLKTALQLLEYNLEKSHVKKTEKKQIVKDPALITPKLFDAFWAMYPNKKGSKGKTRSLWIKLCMVKSKNKLVPTWIEVRRAIKRQIKSERWKEGFIPLSSTWLNQTRWIDDPSEMKSFKKFDSVSSKPLNNFATINADKFFDDNTPDFMSKYAKLIVDVYALDDFCKLYEHCKLKQERPDYTKHVPKYGETGHGVYCTWQSIPKPYQMVTEFIDWIIKTKGATDFKPGHFKPEGTLFVWYIQELRERFNHDPFTGREI